MKVFATTAGVLMLMASLQAQIPDFTPQTPLIGALLHNDSAEAARLLRQGADPNEGRFVGLPPVMLAAVRQDVELVRLMAAKGADLNVRDRSGSTALMWGAFNDTGDAAMVEALLAPWRRSSRLQQSRRNCAGLGAAARGDPGGGGAAEGGCLEHRKGTYSRSEGPGTAAGERIAIRACVEVPLMPPPVAAADGLRRSLERVVSTWTRRSRASKSTMRSRR